MAFQITENLVREIVNWTDKKGLSCGLGSRDENQTMCVEALVCYLMGDAKHHDQPSCVAESVALMKIKLNDVSWTSNKARGKGLQKLAIAQLGSRGIDDWAFFKVILHDCAGRLAKEQLQEIIAYSKNVDKIFMTEVSYIISSCTEMIGLISEWEADKKENWRRLIRDCGREIGHLTGITRDSAALCGVRRLVERTRIFYGYLESAGTHFVTTKSITCTGSGLHNALIQNIGHDYNSSTWDSSLTKIADVLLNALKEVKSPGCEWLHLIDKYAAKQA